MKNDDDFDDEGDFCRVPVGVDGDETYSEIEWCGNALPCETHAEWNRSE